MDIFVDQRQELCAGLIRRPVREVPLVDRELRASRGEAGRIH